MSTVMVERVAKAMFEADQLSDEAQMHEWPDSWRQSKNAYVNLARAAISAMREPTGSMTIASLHTGWVDPAALWRAMIDAALGREGANE